MGNFGFDPFSLGDIGDLLSEIEGAILDALEYIWNVLVAVFQYLLSILQLIAQAVIGVLKVLESLIIHLLEELYTTILKPLLDELAKLYKWLNGIASHVLAWIRRAQKWYNTYIRPWQLLINQDISIIRRFLAVFKLFGAKWAAKLDADFAQVQLYVNESLLLVNQTINSIVSWLQLVTDPRAFISAFSWTRSAWAGLGDIFNVVNLGGITKTSPQEHASAQAQVNLNNSPNTNFTAGPNGSATPSPEMAQLIQNQKQAALYFNPTLPGYNRPTA